MKLDRLTVCLNGVILIAAATFCSCSASFTDLSEAPSDASFAPFGEARVGDAGLIASGAFAGLSGYNAAGTAELARLANGIVELRFSNDFSVSTVPGPVVVLTPTSDFGPDIDPVRGHINLGTLASSTGAQSYRLPSGDFGQRFAWVYCAPFTVEVARAQLRE